MESRKLRVTGVVLTLGGVVTASRIYCAFVSDDRAATSVSLAPFTAVLDIVGHDDTLVRRAAAVYSRLWHAPLTFDAATSAQWGDHRTSKTKRNDPDEQDANDD